MKVVSSPLLSGDPAILFVAHPGHELRVLEWMQRARPLVLILTDGSGSASTSRIESSRVLVARSGGRAGPIFGRFADRALYALMRRGDLAAFVGLAAEVADLIATTGARTICGDAAEGFNSSHDVCRLLIQAAVRRTARVAGSRLANYAFALDHLDGAGRTPAVSLCLSEAEIAAKFRRVRDEYPSLAGELDRAISRHGAAATANEALFDAGEDIPTEWTEPDPPFYERFGARRVAEGLYADTITFADHIRPIALALRDWSDGPS